MTGDLDPEHFFDAYPRFLETSETGRSLERFNARYQALIHANRAVIAGANVLDLASHDGRWSFAALQAGAAHVIGIEHKPRLAQRSIETMAFYGIAPDRYAFVTGDMFERIDEIEGCDVVFCFGVFYHVNNHMLLLSKIARLQPRVLIIDTNISLSSDPVIELVHEPTGGDLVGRPSIPALEAMIAAFGWTISYFDWKHSGFPGLGKGQPLTDYWSGERRPPRRLTAVVTCGATRTPAAPAS